VEIELEAVRVEKSSVFDRPGSSAFVYRGGQSMHLDAGQIFPAGDSAFVRDDRVQKAADELDFAKLLKL
jgi:hypothetical protein